MLALLFTISLFWIGPMNKVTQNNRLIINSDAPVAAKMDGILFLFFRFRNFTCVASLLLDYLGTTVRFVFRVNLKRNDVKIKDASGALH